MAAGGNGTAHVAVYWDFENIHAALLDTQQGEGSYRASRGRTQQRVIQLGSVMDYIASLGDVVVHRAYANWRWLERYREDLLDHAIDLIQLFPRGANSKNGADIRLALDALEDVHHFPHISHVVIVACDSDYTAVGQKIRQGGRTVIGIGVQERTNAFWVRACNEFKFYSTLLAKSGESDAGIGGVVVGGADIDEARRLVATAMRRLIGQRGEEQIVKAALRPMLMRLDPTFDEANFGFASFGAFLDACDGVVRIRAGDHDHLLVLTDRGRCMVDGVGRPTDGDADTDAPLVRYERILKGQGIRLVGPELRRIALELIHSRHGPAGAPAASWSDLEDGLAAALLVAGHDVEEADVRKIRAMAFRARLFRFLPEGQGIALIDGVDATELQHRVERELVHRIAERAEHPVDLAALCTIVHGDSAANVDEMRALLAEVTSGLEAPR